MEYLISTLLQILMVILPLIMGVAYLTYAERKIIGAVQLRLGPTTVGPFGLLQPIADAMKLLFKENIFPTKGHKLVFLIAPMTTFILAFMGWAVIPWNGQFLSQTLPPEVQVCFFDPIVPSVIANINVGVLYVLAISSLGVYGIIMAGWASNSHYAFLGALRSASQMISYEVAIGLVIVCVVILTGSLNLAEIVVAKHNLPYWVDLFMLPMAIVFFISILAETNRHPFDLPEAEAELVAGYNVEYSSISFALFFLGEYANMILTSALMVIFFLGGWYPPLDIDFLYYIPGLIWFCLKIFFVLFWFILVRAALPRYRYDQLMRVGWKVLLPFSLFYVILSSLITLIM